MKLQTILNQIGLNEKEAKIYLTLLRLGEASLQQIASVSNIPRTTLYTPIKTLTKKGAVEFYKRKGRNYYIASPPEKLLTLAENNLETFRENISELNSLADNEFARPEIKFFEGHEGVKLLFSEILEEKRPILAITSVEDMQTIATEYFEDFIEKRIKQKLIIQLLTNRSIFAHKLKDTDEKEFRHTRFVPPKYKFHTANYIFGHKVAIIAVNRTPILGVLINDADIAETQRMYFEMIWNNIAEM